MKKIVLLANHGIGLSVMGRFKELHPEIEIIQVSELVELKNPFDKEPILYHNYRHTENDIKLYEKEPSKFISKPKNNFRKR